MYELFTLGGGTYLVDLLNAVAAITGGGAYIALAQLAGIAGLGWILFRTAFGGSWKDNAKWILLFAAVWGAMIVPKATVRVVDRMDPTLAPAVVANVPIGLALFASLTSQVGDGLTRLTEQAFTLPDDLQYRRHGLIFGARLAAKTTRLEITDTVFARNIRNYARQCVFHALLLGHISADDLRESTDIWSLVTATGHAVGRGLARAHVRVRDAAAGRRRRHDRDRARDRHLPGGRGAPQCPVERRDRARRHRVRAADIPRRQDRGARPGRAPGRAAGRARLPDRGIALRRRDHAPADGAERGPRRRRAVGGGSRQCRRPALLYRGKRAEAQTVSAYRAIGRQAETWVPLLKIVFECLYIGAFPMAVLLMLTPAGTAIFRSYVTGLIWLQSWGPLYAVLHRIAMGEAAERMSGGRGDAGGRDRHLAGGPGRHPGGRLRRRGDVGISLDVGAVPGGGIGLRPLEGDRARDLGAGGRPGRGKLGRARGHDGQPLARQHGLRHAPVRHPGGPPDPHLGPCRYRPLHGLCARRRGHDGDRGRDGGGRCRRRHQPDSGRRGAAVRIPRDQPRAARGRGPDPVAALVGGSRPGAQRRRHRRDGANAALLARRQHGRGLCARGHRERERARRSNSTATSRSCRRSPAYPRTRRRC